MEKIFKLKSVFQPKIWGEEEWLISAHPNGESTIASGEFSGMSLREFFQTKKQYFNNSDLEEFPLLVKIIDAKDDLSIQVHPDDVYARKNENSLGKTECWYILDSAKDSDIIVGQKAKSREELQELINEDKLLDAMNILPIKADDFFYIPAGTVHAIRENTKILEVQQSSDVTYRLFDYNRRDDQGNLRELHIEKSLDVINYDAVKPENEYKIFINDNLTITTFVDNEFFTVKKVKLTGKTMLESKLDFIIGTVTEGEFTINGMLFTKGEPFLIPALTDVQLQGTGELFLSYIEK